MARELKNILINRIIERSILRVFDGLGHVTKIIDIGCGVKPYESMLSPYVEEHVGVDHEDSLHDNDSVDLVGSAYDIPVPDASFDVALCTAVLEHLEEPKLAIQECARVLKPEGLAIYTVPFIWHLHEEPRDFYRYSKYGLKYLFEEAGFCEVKIEALSGFWVTFGQLFVYNLYRLNFGPLRWFRIIDLLGLVIQGLAFLLDRIDRTEQWTWMYMVVARKPTREVDYGEVFFESVDETTAV